MGRNPNVVPKRRVLRPFIRAVRRATSRGPSCRICGSRDVRRSLRRNFLDVVLACLFFAPYRCRLCRHRFYRFWRPFQKTAEPPRAPLLMMPRQVFAIEATDSRTLEPEALPTPPERVAPRLVEPSPPAAKAVPFARPRSILILEGDLSIRKLLRRLLDRRGHFIHEMLEPSALPGELRGRHVDLLIADAALLGPDPGSHVLAVSSAHPDLKVLALSSEPLDAREWPERCVALVKPFSLDRFLETVERLFEFKSASGE